MLRVKLSVETQREIALGCPKNWSEQQKEEWIAEGALAVEADAKLRKPNVEARSDRRQRFDTKAETSRRFAGAFAATDNIEWQTIRQMFTMALRREKHSVEEAIAGANRLCIALSSGAEAARYFAKTYPGWLKANPRLSASWPKTPAQNQRAAGDSLIFDLMEVFYRIGGERPSAVDEGQFAKAAGALLRALRRHDVQLGKKRLSRIIKKHYAGHRSPSRGPKPRA